MATIAVVVVTKWRMVGVPSFTVRGDHIFDAVDLTEPELAMVIIFDIGAVAW